MNCRLRVLFLVFFVLMLGGFVGHILPVQSQLSGGDILVIDPEAGTGGLGALFRVNPSTGARTLLSDFGNALQGQTGVVPAGVAVEYSGNILVIDPDAGTGTLGALFRVNPSTGARTLLSDFGVGTPAGVEPFGVAVYPVLPRPVGGYVESVNKVGILTPYLALAGLVIAVSAVVVFKKRSRD